MGTMVQYRYTNLIKRIADNGSLEKKMWEWTIILIIGHRQKLSSLYDMPIYNYYNTTINAKFEFIVDFVIIKEKQEKKKSISS